MSFGLTEGIEGVSIPYMGKVLITLRLLELSDMLIVSIPYMGKVQRISKELRTGRSIVSIPYMGKVQQGFVVYLHYTPYILPCQSTEM